MLEINSNRPDIINNNEESEYLMATPFSLLLKLCRKKFGNKLENCGILLAEKGNEDCSIISYAFYATVDGKQKCVEVDNNDIYVHITDFWESLDAEKYAGFFFVIDAKTEALVINFVKSNFVDKWAKTDYDYDVYENWKYYNKCVTDLNKRNK